MGGPCSGPTPFGLREERRWTTTRSSPTDFGRSAGERLFHLRQGTRSAQEFALDFRTLAASAGWNDRALIDHYRCSLREDVRRELACRDATLTLDQLVDMSIRLDNLLATRGRPDQGPANQPVSQPTSTPMELAGTALRETGGRVLSCTNCGRRGHTASRCWTDPPGSRGCRQNTVGPSQDQLKCCVGAGEGRDTEALTGGEPDKQYRGCDTRLSEDDCPQTTEDQISPVITPDEPDCKSPIEETEDLISPVITPDEPDNTSPLEETEVLISPVITPDEPDSTSPLEETEDPLPFPDISGPLLDTSVLRARAELRKSRRTRPPRTIRQSSTTVMLDPVHDWRFYDSSKKVDSLTCGDCESDEEQPRGREICSPPSQPQRIALFSGMDPSALKAQLKKRGGKGGGGGGGVAGGGEGVKTDRQTDRLEPSPSQLSHSPRHSSFLPGASRVLPPVENKGGGRVKSPSWLRELKFKKRSSQQ